MRNHGAAAALLLLCCARGAWGVMPLGDGWDVADTLGTPIRLRHIDSFFRIAPCDAPTRSSMSDQPEILKEDASGLETPRTIKPPPATWWNGGLFFVACPKLQASPGGALVCAAPRRFLLPTMQWRGESTHTYLRKWPGDKRAHSDIADEASSSTLHRSSFTSSNAETDVGPHREQSRLLNFPADGPQLRSDQALPVVAALAGFFWEFLAGPSTVEERFGRK